VLARPAQHVTATASCLTTPWHGSFLVKRLRLAGTLQLFRPRHAASTTDLTVALLTEQPVSLKLGVLPWQLPVIVPNMAMSIAMMSFPAGQARHTELVSAGQFSETMEHVEASPLWNAGYLQDQIQLLINQLNKLGDRDQPSLTRTAKMAIIKQQILDQRSSYSGWIYCGMTIFSQ